ncbi:MAG: hypothetical protein H8E72_05950, partial [Candidatus Marinimicrobia bacterium]|nr:hypothetical protein [Candidatus Neomarinimicrobiota bacterium]
MKKLIIAMMLASSLLIVGCSTHVHTVGAGPQTGEVTSARQWYVLFGLVPLNTVDVNEMSGDAKDLEIKTSTAPLDIIIGIPASYITVSSRT